MRALLDVNFLVALLDQQHVRHLSANRWIAVNSSAGWATCPFSENGCLRIITNRRYSTPQSPANLLARFEDTKHGGNHEFWPDDLSVTNPAVFDWNRLQGHQQITDIYLLALAVAHGGRLVTLDQRIQPDAVQGYRPEHLVTL